MYSGNVPGPDGVLCRDMYVIYFGRSHSLTVSGTETVFTGKEVGKPAVMKDDRPALIVSSTSWTEDEDFGLLFDALKLYNTKAMDVSNELPKLVVVVTGTITVCPEYIGLFGGMLFSFTLIQEKVLSKNSTWAK